MIQPLLAHCDRLVSASISHLLHCVKGGEKLSRSAFTCITTFLLILTISACFHRGTLTRDSISAIQPPLPVCTPGESRIVCADRSAEFSAEALTSEANLATTIATTLTTPVIFDPPKPTPFGFVMTYTLDAGSLVIFQGRSAYPKHLQFTVTFDSRLWNLQEADLVNMAISGCTFSLVGMRNSMAEVPVITNSEVAGFPLEIRSFLQEGMVSYGLTDPDNSDFLFVLHVPVAGSEQEATDCRQMAETVLSTFQLARQDELNIDYWPWEQKPGMPPSTPMETTPTPSDEEAKLLPKVTPPMIPTVEVIDLAPGANYGTTYDIVIRRAGTGELVYIRVLAGTDPEPVLEKYLNPGDEVVEKYVPFIGGPPPEPPTETPISK